MKNDIYNLAQNGVATHFGDDLDNKMSLYYLKENGYIPEDYQVKRTPAGQPVSGMLNVDVGNPDCTEPITKKYAEGDSTKLDYIAIDHHFNKRENTLQVLKEDLGIEDIPNQLLEITDKPQEKSSFIGSHKSPIGLARNLEPEQIHDLARNNKLTEELTKKEMEEYGIEEASQEQKKTEESAVTKVKEGKISDKVTHVKEFVPCGSIAAYEKGFDVYTSSQEHKSGEGITFGITAKPGTKLPRELQDYGKSLQEQYGNGVFVKENMIIAGGPKNPDFSVPIKHEDIAKKLKESCSAEKRLEETFSKIEDGPAISKEASQDNPKKGLSR